jgi:hypothetical protein
METLDVVVAGLFGDAVDPRELRDVIAKANDSSEMHVKTAGVEPKSVQLKHKRQAQVGLASNVLGLTAGVAATAAAVRNPALKRPMMENAGPVVRRLAPYLKTNAGRARLIRTGAIGALGLQAANTGGDVIANRVLNRESKKDVSKALTDIVLARQQGRVTTEQAIALASDIVSKVVTPDSKAIHDAVDAIAPAIPSKKVQLGLKAAKGIQQGAQAAAPAVQQGAKGGKKILGFAKKTVAQPITPNIPDPVAKSGPAVTWSGEISKMDTDKRQVFGFALVTHVDGEPVIDRQGDYTPLEEIEKSAYTYVIESRKGGDMHRRDGENPLHTSDLIESFVITPEKLSKMGLAEDALPHGWWVGFKVNDDQQWDDVKTGKRTSFSIHGSGRRVEKMMGV